MAKDVVRIRLDIPRRIYHESKAAVEKCRARNDAKIRTLSDLITAALEKYMKGEQE